MHHEHVRVDESVVSGNRGSRCFSDVVSRGHPRDAISYIIALLAELNRGHHVNIDFLGREDIGKFCRLLEFDPARNWAAITLDQLAPAGERGPREIPASEATVLLRALTELIDRGAFTPIDGSTFDPTVLNDFLPAGTTFHGRPCLGNDWEFRYGLAVELEHGRTFGANATNNHPALTAMIVLGHVLEDSLYYARLWVMEMDGELLKLRLSGAPADQIAAVEQERKRALDYLQFRNEQKGQK